MYRNESKFLQEVIASYYQRGLLALEEGEIKKAQKLIYSAAENTLLLAKDSSDEKRMELIERADQMCDFAKKMEIKEEEKREEEQPLRRNSTCNRKLDPCEEETPKTQKFADFLASKLTFDDVVGLEDVKDEVRRLAIYPRQYPEVYKRFKKKMGGGILLYGVPGTGKTMIANAIANELGATFYPIKCSDLLSKWFGEAEQNVKDLFEEARKNPISVIFFDEFDALGTKRDTDSSSMKRIIPELLIEMQRSQDGENTLIVIAATNRPWDIDSAFLRPGRFKLSIHVPLPDADARRAMIDSMLNNIPKDDNLEVEKIVQLSDGFSGADIVEVCEKLKDCAIDRIINEGGEGIVVNGDIDLVFASARSSVQAEDIAAIDSYKAQQFCRKC